MSNLIIETVPKTFGRRNGFYYFSGFARVLSGEDDIFLEFDFIVHEDLRYP